MTEVQATDQQLIRHLRCRHSTILHFVTSSLCTEGTAMDPSGGHAQIPSRHMGRVRHGMARQEIPDSSSSAILTENEPETVEGAARNVQSSDWTLCKAGRQVVRMRCMVIWQGAWPCPVCPSKLLHYA